MEKQPLASPASDSAEDFEKFIDAIYDDATRLQIVPSDEQTSSWTVEVGRATIPIGATAVWFPFGNTPQNYQMSGLTGCTAIIAVVSFTKVSETSPDIG